MKIIKELSDDIECTIANATYNAQQAVELKDDHKSIAEVYYKMSVDNLSHVLMLHGEVVKLIDDYRKTNGDPPEPMLAVYNYLHKKHIEAVQEAKNYQIMYKE